MVLLKDKKFVSSFFLLSFSLLVASDQTNNEIVIANSNSYSQVATHFVEGTFIRLPDEMYNSIVRHFSDEKTSLRSVVGLRAIDVTFNRHIETFLKEYITFRGMTKYGLSSWALMYKDLWKLAVKVDWAVNEKLLDSEHFKTSIPFLYALLTDERCCIKKLFGLKAYDFYDDIQPSDCSDIVQVATPQMVTYVNSRGESRMQCPILLAFVDGNKNENLVFKSVRSFALKALLQKLSPKIMLFQKKGETIYWDDISGLTPGAVHIRQEGIKKPGCVLICESRQPSDYNETHGDLTIPNGVKRDNDGWYIDYSYAFLYQDCSNKDVIQLSILLFPSWCLQRSKEQWEFFYGNCMQWIENVYKDEKRKIFCRFSFPYGQTFDGCNDLLKESQPLFCKRSKKIEVSSLFYSVLQIDCDGNNDDALIDAYEQNGSSDIPIIQKTRFSSPNFDPQPSCIEQWLYLIYCHNDVAEIRSNGWYNGMRLPSKSSLVRRWHWSNDPLLNLIMNNGKLNQTTIAYIICRGSDRQRDMILRRNELKLYIQHAIIALAKGDYCDPTISAYDLYFKYQDKLAIEEKNNIISKIFEDDRLSNNLFFTKEMNEFILQNGAVLLHDFSEKIISKIIDRQEKNKVFDQSNIQHLRYVDITFFMNHMKFYTGDERRQIMNTLFTYAFEMLKNVNL